MDLNIFFGFFLLAFFIILTIVWYFVAGKKLRMPKKCTEKVVGEVVRYTLASYGGVGLPVVKYTVQGKDYKVVGPKFAIISSVTVSKSFNQIERSMEHNLTTRDNLPDVLKMKIYQNSHVSIGGNPLRDLYPVGSTVDVYYDPGHPKTAYVQRFVKPHWAFNVMLVIGLICLAASMFLLFARPI